MPSGVLQRSQRLTIGQDNWLIEALIPRHDATSATEPWDSRKRGGDSFRDSLSHGPEEPLASFRRPQC